MAPASRDRLVLRVNEIYHDLENREYDGKHPDILEDEIQRWKRFGSRRLAGNRPAMDVLDLGCGTGFVPLQLKEWLGPEDRLTCADISAAMLEVCKSNLEAAGLPCRMTMAKLDGRGIPAADRSQDLVTVNAVMHHLSRPGDFCREIDRVLRPGGHVMVGHEPNRAHFAHRILAWNYWMLLPLADWKLFGYEILLRLGLFEPLRRPLEAVLPELRLHNRLMDAVNERLLAEGEIDSPLPAAGLSALLDANSPTAGGIHRERGFAREDFPALFPGYVLKEIETYKHLNKIHPEARWIKGYEGWLARRYPDHGSSLFCVLAKPLG